MRARLFLIITVISLLILGAAQACADFIEERNFAAKNTITSNKTQYSIFVEVEDNILYLMQDGKCIKTYPVASGRSGHPSPIGYWKIIDKSDWGGGFGGRWMGLNVPWGMYGIHGTSKENTIGSPASAGCIRMYNDDVAELYDIVPVGTPVTIVNGSFGPFGQGFSTIYPGDRGADVLEIQRRLKDLGYYDDVLDGIYQDDLKKAIHKFQKEHKLRVKNEITKEDWTAMGFREFE